jgi:hypothetical protein
VSACPSNDEKLLPLPNSKGQEIVKFAPAELLASPCYLMALVAKHGRCYLPTSTFFWYMMIAAVQPNRPAGLPWVREAQAQRSGEGTLLSLEHRAGRAGL